MSVGFWQLVVVAALAIIFFGTGRLPGMMRDVALGIRSFKKGLVDGDTPEEETPTLDHQPKKRKRKTS